MRPVVSNKEDEVRALNDGREQQSLDRVARKMHATIRAIGKESAGTLLESRRRARTKGDRQVPLSTAFEAVGAIIYAMEWTSDQPGAGQPAPIPTGADTGSLQAAMGPFEPGYVFEFPRLSWSLYESKFRRLFELMLVIDYGFPTHPIFGPKLRTRIGCLEKWSQLETFCDFLVGIARFWRWRQGLPSDASWGLIAEVVNDWVYLLGGLRVPVWDVATMIYYYRLHRNPGEAEEGWIEYTGVLQEMIAEVPTRGVDRLQRKLSLDAHLLIPKFVRDRELRKQILLVVQDLAAKHGCQLAPPDMPKPRLWQRLFGQVSLQQGSEEKNEYDGDVKVLEGQGWENKGDFDLKGDREKAVISGKCT